MTKLEFTEDMLDEVFDGISDKLCDCMCIAIENHYGNGDVIGEEEFQRLIEEGFSKYAHRFIY